MQSQKRTLVEQGLFTYGFIDFQAVSMRISFWRPYRHAVACHLPRSGGGG